MGLFPWVMDGSFSGGVAPPSSGEKVNRTVISLPAAMAKGSNDLLSPAEVSGTEQNCRRSAPASVEPMPGVTDEEYIQAAVSVLAIGEAKRPLG